MLLDKFGRHLGEFVSYRDDRTVGMQEKLLQYSTLTKDDIYSITGIPFLTFNTINPLKSITDDKPSCLNDVDTLLFIPDYLNYKLSGVKNCEYTNASTSQLLECNDKACGAKTEWFLPPKMPNHIVGQYQVGDINIPVCSIPSHDTAAVALADEKSAYLISGTWSLLGIESKTPIVTPKGFYFNITNEGGVDGRYRILKNIMGLWLIQRVKFENPTYHLAIFAH